MYEICQTLFFADTLTFSPTKLSSKCQMYVAMVFDTDNNQNGNIPISSYSLAITAGSVYCIHN